LESLENASLSSPLDRRLLFGRKIDYTTLNHTLFGIGQERSHIVGVPSIWQANQNWDFLLILFPLAIVNVRKKASEKYFHVVVLFVQFSLSGSFVVLWHSST